MVKTQLSVASRVYNLLKSSYKHKTAWTIPGISIKLGEKDNAVSGAVHKLVQKGHLVVSDKKAKSELSGQLVKLYLVQESILEFNPKDHARPDRKSYSKQSKNVTNRLTLNGFNIVIMEDGIKITWQNNAAIKCTQNPSGGSFEASSNG